MAYILLGINRINFILSQDLGENSYIILLQYFKCFPFLNTRYTNATLNHVRCLFLDLTFLPAEGKYIFTFTKIAFLFIPQRHIGLCVVIQQSILFKTNTKHQKGEKMYIPFFSNFLQALYSFQAQYIFLKQDHQNPIFNRFQMDFGGLLLP